LSELYYNELSSWNTAEQHARLNLARRIRLSIQSLQKSTIATGEALQREKISATIRNIEVVDRWRDVKNGAMFVLSRTSLNEQ
jgi:hypothetical protein